MPFFMLIVLSFVWCGRGYRFFLYINLFQHYKGGFHFLLLFFTKKKMQQKFSHKFPGKDCQKTKLLRTWLWLHTVFIFFFEEFTVVFDQKLNKTICFYVNHNFFSKTFLDHISSHWPSLPLMTLARRKRTIFP